MQNVFQTIRFSVSNLFGSKAAHRRSAPSWPKSILVLVSIFLSISSNSLTAIAAERELATKPSPPFAMKNERGEVDAAASAVTVTGERERLVDFTSPYFHSGLAIAVREKESSWLHIIGRLFSPAFLRVLAALSLLPLLSERIFRPEYYAIALPQGSLQREALNRALLDIMASDRLREITFRYLHTRQ